MKLEEVDINSIKPYKNNPREISKEAVDKVKKSIKEFGYNQPIVVDKDNIIVVGHTRWKALQQLGKQKAYIVKKDFTKNNAMAYRIMDNRSGEESKWDSKLLLEELNILKDESFNLDLTGFDKLELSKFNYLTDPTKKQNMSRNFIVPPFSVLDAKQGYWQDRKREWINLGIDSGEGRGENLLDYSEVAKINSGTSIFDPVLCEILIKWFSAKNSTILDPFSGGSVRGIVSSICQRNYIGIDISKEQIEANNKQSKITSNNKHKPQWIIGNSLNIKEIVKNKANMILSCPPYHDLEKYTEDKNDLSNLSYEEFSKQYEKIIKDSCDLLEDNSFACWVVGEIRYKTDSGHYKNFVNNTIDYFIKAGLKYYNEMILTTAVGSLPLRAGKVFKKTRKIGKQHQNILIFLKGDINKTVEKLDRFIYLVLYIF